MAHGLTLRNEMVGAVLNIGGTPIELDEYATTGLLAVAIGPRGNGKTNAGLLISEQLSEQGWVSVLIDPESELEALYGAAVKSADELSIRLKERKQKIIVVAAKDATEFLPFGYAILEAAEEYRKPVFVMIDEGQLFSAAKKRKDDVGEAAEIINQFAERGRKRALDFFVTAHKFTSSINRTIFSNKNLTLIGCQEDPAAWSNLSVQFKGTKIGYNDLNALAPGEFYCFSRRGVEKIRMPMCEALEKVAPKAKRIKRVLPTTFRQWSEVLAGISSERLEALTPQVINLLGAVAGLSPQQMMTGIRAMNDELEARL